MRISPASPAASSAGTTVRPRATSSTASTISARLASFARYPAAPSCSAWNTTELSVCAESSSTRVRSPSRTAARTTPSPSTSGIS